MIFNFTNRCATTWNINEQNSEISVKLQQQFVYKSNHLFFIYQHRNLKESAKIMSETFFLRSAFNMNNNLLSSSLQIHHKKLINQISRVTKSKHSLHKDIYCKPRKQEWTRWNETKKGHWVAGVTCPAAVLHLILKRGKIMMARSVLAASPRLYGSSEQRRGGVIHRCHVKYLNGACNH